MRFETQRSPRTLLSSSNVRTKKHWGQHFLSQPAVAEKIVELAGILSGDTILEIGAGLGALTIPLARAADKVFAVEIDSELTEVLKGELFKRNISNVVLINRDILQIDFKAFVFPGTQKIVVFGNLPYNISSQVIIRLIESRQVVSRAVFMLQKELARRLTARPGCKDYGRLTVVLDYCSVVRKLVEVPGSVFFPKADVDSQVLEIRFKDAPDHPASDETLLLKVVKAGFSKRRKTLKNALSGGELALDAKTAEKVLEYAGIAPCRRAETLSVAEFVALTEQVGNTIPS